MHRVVASIFLWVAMLLTVGCSSGATPSPPASTLTVTQIQNQMVEKQVSVNPSSTPAAHQGPPQLSSTTMVLSPTPPQTPVVWENEILEDLQDVGISGIQPTAIPQLAGDAISVSSLPIGNPGEYVNVTLGYWVHYPSDWYTEFGNRPLLVSFSNLDPGKHNRESMRQNGCLIELNADTNVFGFTLDNLMAALRGGFSDAEELSLGSRRAISVHRSNPKNSYDSEWIYVDAGVRLLVLTFDYARSVEDKCRPVWDQIVSEWEWFEPDFIDYRNTNYGYTISYPRRWFRFNERREGVTLSSTDPTNLESVSELVNPGMVIHTTVADNPSNLPLHDWVRGYEGDVAESNEIPLGNILGIRVTRDDPAGQLQEMSAYYMGPSGRIIIINALYPLVLQDDYRPIANAVIYSFGL